MAIVIVEDLLCSNLMIDDLVFCFLFCFFFFRTLFRVQRSSQICLSNEGFALTELLTTTSVSLFGLPLSIQYVQSNLPISYLRMSFKLIDLSFNLHFFVA